MAGCLCAQAHARPWARWRRWVPVSIGWRCGTPAAAVGRRCRGAVRGLWVALRVLLELRPRHAGGRPVIGPS
jgi:hypothetical protein